MSRSRDRKREKQQEYLRAKGLAGYVPAGPVRERLRQLHDESGMTFDVIAARTGLDRETVLMQYRGVNKHRNEIRSCQFATAQKILGSRFRPEDGAWWPSLGIRRRLQALAALGYTTPFLADRLEYGDYRILHHVVMGRKAKRLIQSDTAQAVILLYGKLAWADPVAEGVDKQAAARCRTISKRNGYVPPLCWDDDTIEDPQAIPQWTGECGTWLGARIHKRDGIEMCPECEPHDGPLVIPGFSPDRLREIRESRGLSRRGLAAQVGIDDTTLKFWETGRSAPRDFKIDRLLGLLDVTFRDVTESEEV